MRRNTLAIADAVHGWDQPPMRFVTRREAPVSGRMTPLDQLVVHRGGALAAALTFGGDSVMLGGASAGTDEAPGEVVHKSVLLPDLQKTIRVPFKVLRGMASVEAIRDRLDVEDADKVELEALGAEGMEISVPACGSARIIVRDMLRHLCSSISDGGASSLGELRALFWADPLRYVIKQSASARRESYEH